MLDFKFFHTLKIKPTYNLIHTGIEKKIFHPNSLLEYIFWKINNDIDISESELKIISGKDNELITNYLKNNIPSVTETDIRTLRYIVLKSLSSSGEQLLQDISCVYADFGYPEDMIPFIYYMPKRNSQTQTGCDYLISLFSTFLENEYEYIQQHN